MNIVLHIRKHISYKAHTLLWYLSLIPCHRTVSHDTLCLESKNFGNGQGHSTPGIDIDLAVVIMAEQWRILVIESEEHLNWNMVNALQKDGYIVRGVTSGGEAIRLLWSEEYDVVICNQQMPDADGFDLLQWMRNYSPDSRMIMLGAPGNGAARAQALEMGVVSYLEKPLDLPALKAELRRMLHSTGFSASLDSFDLLDVVQIITLSRKSIALVVSTGLEEQGVLRFQNGELISADYGILRGEEAFFALAAHKNGTVVQHPWHEQVEPNVTQPLSRLIFQALQYRAKYAEAQQASSELEAVQPASNTPLPPMPSTVFPEALQDLDDDDRPFQFIPEDLEIDDRPFQYVAEAREEDDRPFQYVAETREEDDQPFQFVAETREEQDQPFQFVAEEPVAEKPRATSALEQLIRGTASSGSALEQLEALRNPTQNSGGTGSTSNEWWQPARPFPAMQPSGSMRAITDGTQATPLVPAPTPAQKTPAAQSSVLPSWLTEPPASQNLPAQRAQTGHMPAVPPTPPTPYQASPARPAMPYQASPATPYQLNPTTPAIPYQASPTMPYQVSPVTPAIPHQASPTTPYQASAMVPTTPPQVGPTVSQGLPSWQQPAGSALNTSAAGLRKTKPEEALYTGHQQAIRPGTHPAPEGQSAPASERQGDVSGPLRAVKPETLHSLAALKKANVTPSASAPVHVPGKSSETQPAPPAREWEMRDWPRPPQKFAEETSKPRVTAPLGPTSRRNYPALAAALQTLGHSVPGFVASAVINLDGTPIAQVTADELDISPLCAHVSQVLRGALQTLQQGHWEPYEHTIISSRTRHILLRLIGNTSDTFQVLITTRETPPAESLEALANVEAAIAAALR